MKINEILKQNNLIAKGYEKIGKVIKIDTNKGKYIYKEGNINNQILNYLKSRSFDYMPSFLNNENDSYRLEYYIENLDIPTEQKALDLMNLISLLHSKTTHYKEIDLDKYEEIYEDLDNNLKYLYNYYTDMITIIESKVFMSPSESLIARNITKIYETLDNNKQLLNQWHSLIKEKDKERRVVIHNNLNINHFIRNENSYLISWDKAKIDVPIFDLYKFYKRHALDFDFIVLLNEYEKTYPLTLEEKKLLFILISEPDLITFNYNEYENCKNISRSIDKIYKTEKLIKESKDRDKK